MPKKHTTSNKIRKRKGKDIDQIIRDMEPDKRRHLSDQEVDLDLPGNGQFYCVECARYFIDEQTRNCHWLSKVHRQRCKRLRESAYTQHEAEEAAGLKSTNAA